MKYYIGVDIGKQGGIVILDEKDNVLTMSMPKINKDEIDIHKISTLLKSYLEDKNNQIHCGMEDLHSVFGAGAGANFQFGRSCGITEGIIAALNIPFSKIPPKTWQKEIWIGIRPVENPTTKKNKVGDIIYKVDTKATSLLAAKRLYPTLDLRATERSKVAHNGIVDALLIATFIKRKGF